MFFFPVNNLKVSIKSPCISVLLVYILVPGIRYSFSQINLSSYVNSLSPINSFVALWCIFSSIKISCIIRWPCLYAIFKMWSNTLNISLSNWINALFTEYKTTITCWDAVTTCFSHFKLFEFQTPRSFFWTVFVKPYSIIFGCHGVVEFRIVITYVILLHLLVLNVRHHLLFHWLKLSKSACQISQSDLFFNVLNVLVSLANIFTLLFTA